MAVDDDLPAGARNVAIGRGKLPGMGVEAIENGNQDENVQEDDDYKGRFT
ncbi:hypothetical protein [Geotalea sp. SG265]|nr:hypothetical protein [Geotalea sp. SG265]